MHPNAELLRRIDEAQGRQDVGTFMDCFTDDVVIHVAGQSSFSGTYKGKEQFMDLFQRFMDRAPGYTFEPHAYLADDEHGVSLQRSRYIRDDERLDTNETFVCHFRNGRVSEIWMSSEDQAGVDAFLG